MEKVQTLADYLGADSGGQAQPTKVNLEDIVDAKAFARAVLSSYEFRRYIVDSLTLGSIPPAVVCRMMDYAWGKPVDRLEVRDVTNQLEHLTVDQLRRRAQFLLEVADRIRPITDEEHQDAKDAGSVH